MELGPEAQALAVTAAQAVVGSVGTDAWPATKGRVARMMGRSDEDRRNIVFAGLDATAAAVSGPGAGDAAREAQERLWQGRLLRMLAEYPDAIDELRALALGNGPALAAADC